MSEKETRLAIREALKTVAKVHLYAGGDTQFPQTLHLEHGKRIEPPLAPKELGADTALANMIAGQDPAIDELGEPLADRWSIPRGRAPAPREVEWPTTEQHVSKAAAGKSLRAARKRD